MKRLRAFFYSKSFNIIFALLLNVALYVCLTIFVSHAAYFYTCLIFTAIFFVMIFFKNSNPKNNLLLVLMSTILPLVALSLIRYSTNLRGRKRYRVKWRELTNLETGYTVEQNNAVLETLSSKSSPINKTSKYLNATLNAPVYENNNVQYIANGKEYFDAVLRELKSAKKYIFIECSRMHDCNAWNDVFQVLKEKSFAGVEIKLLYDDYNSLNAFKDNRTFEKLYNHKIETRAFNPITFAAGRICTLRSYNNTIIVDGSEAFVGQISIDDDYREDVNVGTNLTKKIASAVYVKGDAVISIVKNFVSNWNLFGSTDALVLEKYIDKSYPKVKSKTFVQPFETTPMVKESVCKNIQNNLLNLANKSIWVVSPYLLIGSETRNSLVASARCGIDVNIIVSKNYASRWKRELSYTNYDELIKEGIKIFALEDGILDMQCMIIDNSNLMLGCGNIDSRKMYTNFENGIVIYDDKIASAAFDAIRELLPYSDQLTYKSIKRRRIGSKMYGALLKIFSPLM